MNNVLIYFCANVQILIRPGTIVFTKSDLTPGEKRRISPRFDRAPGAGRIFSKYSIRMYPVAGLCACYRSFSVYLINAVLTGLDVSGGDGKAPLPPPTAIGVATGKGDGGSRPGGF